ncbi:class I SAM-dependent DNA methyltransferase [Bacteroides caecigallinarum]|uniref:class I SAM-dependent DNA methyltransferase n=1 Tax=Bacteroides caecigallinarum TaxID=1411144 RepID=UPI001F262003|nr:class I SAM-dependent DNA methyltransferase [Bacteroides caecigallinarum]MCF2736260.1 N-6 DNA methylase [Bacteroides caecigallinarum]
MINIRKLESELWESADLLRQGSKLTSSQYCMPVLALLFLRYAYSRFKLVETEILKSRPSRGGRVMPVEPSDFEAKSALYLPREAQFDFLVNLPDNISSVGLKNKDGQPVNSLGEAVNNAMQLVEEQSEQLTGVLPKTYTMFADELLHELLRIFNNKTIDEIGGDIIGRIYEYFLSKFAKAVASDDGVFFTPKSLVKMLVNVLEPEQGVMLDPACGSGGMFVQTGDFVNAAGMNANTQMTFFGQEKVEYNAQLCLMNMAVHGLNGRIVSGDEANSFYHDAFNLEGKCDYVIANPPFNVDKVKSESALSAGRLPFGLPGVNAKTKEVGNANYLWISYFYSYLNEHGRAGFVMASSATDSSNKDRDIREQLVKTGHVDVMVSVGNNFFYTLSLPCSLWFFDKAKREENRDKVLFIDARKYYTVVDRTLNEWTEWQLHNLQAIVYLYRGETEKYKALIAKYNDAIREAIDSIMEESRPFTEVLDEETAVQFNASLSWTGSSWNDYEELSKNLNGQIEQTKACIKSAEEKLKKRELKPMRLAGEAFCKMLEEILTVINEYNWLTEKFGNGEYHDIAGLCKIATIDEIEEKNYSLTPGAYVGVAETEDDGVDFHERMNEIHAELAKLHDEANVLMKEILKDWETLK